MKTPQDPRHRTREGTVRALFARTFNPKQPIADANARSVLAHRRRIDGLIAKAAPTWPLSKINRVDLAVLRLATWELVIEKKNPPKVIIDEAVELSKTFGAEGSPGFVNGVLGTLVQSSLT